MSGASRWGHAASAWLSARIGGRGRSREAASARGGIGGRLIWASQLSPPGPARQEDSMISGGDDDAIN